MKNNNSYAELVANSLVTSFHYTEEEAQFLIYGYYSVIKRIGFFDNPQIWASKIDEAMKSNITPDMWHAIL